MSPIGELNLPQRDLLFNLGTIQSSREGREEVQDHLPPVKPTDRPGRFGDFP